jgi:hypothetical protein
MPRSPSLRSSLIACPASLSSPAWRASGGPPLQSCARRIDTATCVPRIDVMSEILPSFLALLPSIRQRGVGIGPEREHLLLARPSISQPPPFGPIRLHKQAQSASIGLFIGAISWSCVLYGDISQSPAKELDDALIRLSRGSCPCFHRGRSYPQIYPRSNCAGMTRKETV